jgi:ABC-2 type transport system ATP-binding protein
MRQRLGLAEIFMKNVDIAILDEPTSGLDPQATAGFLESIQVLKHEGVTVLMSSHLLTQVQRICDRVALFNAGRIALIGSVPELATQVLGGGYHVEVEADGPMLAEKLAAVPGVRSVEPVGPGRFRLLAEGDVRPQAAAAVVNAGGALQGLSFEEPSLGQIYSHYFQNQEGHKGAPHPPGLGRN